MKNRIESLLHFLLPSIGTLLWVTTFIGVLISGPKMINADGDLGRHITVGNYILDNRSIPLYDVFSHTMIGEPLTPHEWLSQVLFAVAHRLMGLDGAILLAALVIATSFWLVFKLSSRERKTFFPLLIMFILILLSSAVHWLARPHIFTFLLLALWMIVLVRMKNGNVRAWWMLPLIMLAWVNLHGAFIAGFVTWLLFGAGLAMDKLLVKPMEGEPLPVRFWRYYVLGGITSLLVTLVNPSGFGLWKTSIGYVSNKFMVDHTVEYQSPDFHTAEAWPFLVFILLLVLVTGLRNRRTRAEWLLPSVAWLAMGLYSARNIPLFVIVASPLLTQGLEDLLLMLQSGNKFLGKLLKRDDNLYQINASLKGAVWPIAAVIIAVAGLTAGIKFDAKQTGNIYDPAKFPVDAVNWLQDNPQQGEMFNYFIWGGYLLYREWPDMRVFIDGQTDFYGEQLTREYLDVITLEPGWESILAAHDVDWVILPVKELAARALEQNEAWSVVYRDETTLLLHRR